MRTGTLALAALGLLALAGPAAAAEPTIPVRVRVLLASRQGPPAVDPRLADLAGQLGKLAYPRWEQASEAVLPFAFGRAAEVRLPDGAALELTLLSSHETTVTFQVRVPGKRAHSRLTISKDQRIVHQVTDERGGVATFVSVRPWP